MKLEQLEQLLTIVENRSMNKAAEELYIARSSLSTSMKRLEEEMGAPIFRRNSKGVSLTDFGVNVYNQAKDICDRISFLKDSSGCECPINLSVATMYCSVANDAFGEIYRRHYKEDFIGKIEETRLSEVSRMVASGLVEIGIVTLFSDSEAIWMRKLDEEGLEFQKIIDRNLHVIVGKENPLYYEERNTVLMEELKDFPYIVNYASPSDYAWERTLEGRKRKNADLQVSDLGCALRLVQMTDAFMIDTYDRTTYEFFYAVRQLRFIPIADAPLACKLGWIKRKKQVLSAVAEEFLNVLTQKAENQ